MDRTLKKAAVYYSAAILFSWLCWIGTIFFSVRNEVQFFYNEGIYTLVTEGIGDLNNLFASFTFMAAVYGPIVGVLAVKLLTKERFRISWWGLRDSGNGRNFRFIVFIFVYPILLFSAAVLLTWLMTGFRSELVPPMLPVWFLPVYFFFQCLTSGMEEVGWRGFLQPLIQSTATAEKACTIVGVMWSVWHYPIIVYMNYEAGYLIVLLTLAGFTMLTIPQAYVLGWLYNSTKSVFLCVILHAWANTVSVYLLTASPAPGLTPIIVAVGAWLVANYLVKRYGKETLSAQEI